MRLYQDITISLYGDYINDAAIIIPIMMTDVSN